MTRAIRRLLIANRGEIAVRIARTAHRLGIGTVGVYSEPDATALHTDVVDVAVALGGATPLESYLRGDAVIAAALTTGCDALHPGYGFLAENAGFARDVVDAGLTWVGPTPEQIALLGDKVAAKTAAREAGLPAAEFFPVEPDGPLPEIDMPVLVKAAAGGGGRGMRVVRERSDLAAAVTEASREAERAFGDGRVFVEPFVERGRHIEVQIFGDAHGTVVHLGERECSIQRRNQKIVEEAPSAGITSEVRALLCDGAVALARHVGYSGAGTVEFLVADDGTIDLLEVNTRLQVEHPVTEAVTGLDLVELQLLVAAGGRLPIRQEDVAIAGHAIEVRVVAEDPAAGWRPSTGTIGGFSIGGDVRVDRGVRTGSVVAADYDSLLAKVIAHGPSRDEAAARLARTLRGAHIAGVATNLATLAAIMEDEDFRDARTPTSYLRDRAYIAAPPGPAGAARTPLLLAAVVRTKMRNRDGDRRWGFAPAGWRNVATIGHRSVWRDGSGEEHHVEERWTGEHEGAIRVGSWPVPGDDGSLGEDDRAEMRVRVLATDRDTVSLEIDGVRRRVTTSGDPEAGMTTTSADGSVVWSLVPRFVDHDAGEAGSGPVSPLPGTVVAVAVETGSRVEAGDELVVVEAMKMEHTVVAPVPAVVVEVLCAVGGRVEAGDLLVRLEPVP